MEKQVRSDCTLDALQGFNDIPFQRGTVLADGDPTLGKCALA